MGLLCCLTLSLNSTTPAKMQLLRWVVLAPQNPTSWSQSRAAMCYVLLQSQAGNVRVAAAASALGASAVSAAAAGGGPGPFLGKAYSLCHCTLRCMHVIARSAITQTKILRHEVYSRQESCPWQGLWLCPCLSRALQASPLNSRLCAALAHMRSPRLRQGQLELLPPRPQLEPLP